MTKSRRKTTKRSDMHFDDPYCPFCLVEMNDPDQFSGEGKVKATSPNDCIIFNTVPRAHPWRGNIKGRKIICCRLCCEHLSARRQSICNGRRSKIVSVAQAFKTEANQQNTSGRQP